MLGREWLVWHQNSGYKIEDVEFLRLMADANKLELLYDMFFKLFEFAAVLNELPVINRL